MKVSIITVCYNSQATIENTIRSVVSQTHSDIEYIIVDGKSSDNTLEIVSKYQDKIAKVISETDQGIYDAMNKGIKAATGDIIGILNSDDYYVDSDVVSCIVKAFDEKSPDMVFADLAFVAGSNQDKILRYYSAKGFTPQKLKNGIMPPHPTLYVKKEVYQKYGNYRLDFKIAADYEMFVRLLLVKQLTYFYINKCIIKMTVGGVSTSNFDSKKIINTETIKALSVNGIDVSYMSIFRKYPTKLFEIMKGRFMSLFCIKLK